MKVFNDLGSFAAFNRKQATLADAELALGITAMALNTHKVASSIFGDHEKLQPPLAPSTQERRVQLGFTPDDPLLRSGTLRDSLKTESAGLIAGVGTEDERMVWQEQGTATIPPRPLLGISVNESRLTNQAIIVVSAKKILGM